ncbi:MAG: M23 family metallopeptidase [Microbacteriaceae bacterium]|nr:M23 family metallopeptidase [Microbacteriaceae bacterium]
MSRALQARHGGTVEASAAASFSNAPVLVGPQPVTPHRSAMTLLRGGSRVLAMIAVVFAFTASVAAVVPNAQAYEAIELGSQAEQGDVQAMAPIDGEVPDPTVSRDGYTVTAAPPPPPPPPPPPVVSTFASPVRMSLTPSSSSASLQWPVPAGTPMSSAFGPRSCSGCSSFHQGVDLNAAAGTPIWSMAAGVVLPPLGSGYSSYGVHVRIQSVVNGEMVETLYAHMQAGSVQVATGQTVAPGQVIGAMGCTGSCSGTHLHFEIQPGGGAPVDPAAWMQSRLG